VEDAFVVSCCAQKGVDIIDSGESSLVHTLFPPSRRIGESLLELIFLAGNTCHLPNRTAQRGGLTPPGFLHRAPREESRTILKRCARATLRNSFRFSRVVLARKQRTCQVVLGVLTLGCCEVLKGTLSTHSRGRKARMNVLVRGVSEFRYSARMPVNDSVLQHAVLCCNMLHCVATCCIIIMTLLHDLRTILYTNAAEHLRVRRCADDVLQRSILARRNVLTVHPVHQPASVPELRVRRNTKSAQARPVEALSECILQPQERFSPLSYARCAGAHTPDRGWRPQAPVRGRLGCRSSR
jgi:hypothetical protein